MSIKAARGRPKDPSKCAAIIVAARHLFAKQGFAKTSMDCLADHSGVSKATLYSHFKNKNDVFKAVIIDKLENYTVSFDGVENSSIEEGLAYFSRQLFELLHDPDVINMQRLVISESNSQHGMADLFFDAGPEPVMKKLTTYLSEREELANRDAAAYRSLCETFASLLIPHHYYVGIMIAHRKPQTKAERQNHIAQSIKGFMSIISDS